MRKNLLIFAITILIATQLTAQIQTQTVKGTILDAQSEMPLIGANIQVIGIDPIIGATADEEGRFSIQNVPLGRQAFQVNYLGCQPAEDYRD